MCYSTILHYHNAHFDLPFAAYSSKTYEMCCITAHGPVDVVCFVVGFSPCQAYLVLLFGKKVNVFAKAAAPPRTENGLYGTQEQ